MGCGASSTTVESPREEEPAQCSDSPLMEEMTKQWGKELNDLFLLWDMRQCGSITPDQIKQTEERCNKNRRAAKPDAVGPGTLDAVGTGQLQKRGLVGYIIKVSEADTSRNLDGSIGAIIVEYIEALKRMHVEALFRIWDHADTGFLSARELNHTIALFNTQDSEDWERCGWPLSKKEAVIVRKQGNLLKTYSGDAKKGTKTDLAAKLSQQELLDYMLTAPVLYNSESKSITFNRMVSKFEELVQCLTPVGSPAASP